MCISDHVYIKNKSSGCFIPTQRSFNLTGLVPDILYIPTCTRGNTEDNHTGHFQHTHGGTPTGADGEMALGAAARGHVL